MGVGSLLGGRLGAGVARRLGARQLRRVVVGFALVPVLFFTGALGEPSANELAATTTTLGGGF